jgi:hypothetical protein
MDPAQKLLDLFCHRQDRARIHRIIEDQKSIKTGVCWIRKHFKRVESNIGFRLGQLADLFLHTEGRSASTSEVEEWLSELGIRAISSFKDSRSNAKTSLVCKTHRHVTVMLPRDYMPVCHPLTEGSLTADKLREILV